MKNKEKIAVKLRESGLSYNVISKKINVAKGTLSYWFKDLKLSESIKRKNINKAKKKWAENITRYNKNRSRVARLKWVVTQDMASKDIDNVNDYELKLLGVALYWAEGYKRGNWNVVFCNSDEKMNKLMIKFFIKICHVPIEKIKCQIQLHNNISAELALKFWSKQCGLSLKHFLEPVFVKNRSSKLRRTNHLPYGTLRIKINDVELVNKIKGWIEGIKMRF